ncbi:MAG: hypothetical protein Q8O60_06345, partial [Deltaproteobacteria bacterium]|nr:hypothetical protein [Deltaproteobacteria bacterium]
QRVEGRLRKAHELSEAIIRMFPLWPSLIELHVTTAERYGWSLTSPGIATVNPLDHSFGFVLFSLKFQTDMLKPGLGG